MSTAALSYDDAFRHAARLFVATLPTLLVLPAFHIPLYRAKPPEPASS